MTTVALVPRRADNGRRDDVWAWVRERFCNLHPDIAVFAGDHDDGPFNRSAAINAAAEQAGDWDTAVIMDADSFVLPDQLERAIDLANQTGQITFAYERFAYLNRKMSDRIMAGHEGNWWPGVEWTLQGTCSSMVICPRPLWDDVGGFDPGFVGWGFEDVGFSLACQAIGDGMGRVAGEVWHLNHPVSPENHQSSPFYPLNVERMKLYQACDYDADRMRALIAELKA